MSEGLAELAHGGLLAWFNPLLGTLAITAVLLLARFRGRVQALTGAFAFTVLALVLAVMSPLVAQAATDLRQLVAAICVAWLCAFLASQRSMRPLSIPPETLKHREEEADAGDLSRVQELVRDHQTQLSLLNERSPGFLWKALPDGKITYVNSYCWHYLGLTADEVRADWIDLIHPDDREEVARRWEIVVNGGQWHDHVHRMRGKDGQYLWFQSRITAVRNESGAVVALHGLMIVADETASAERSVRLEENQLRRLVDAMPAMIWRADPDGKIDRWNRTMVETIGKAWDASETFNLLSRIDPAQVEEVEEQWAKAARSGAPYENTYRILGNDGNYHWHIVRAQPFRDDGGNIISWYGIHTDIDALKEAERKLQAREHQLLDIIDTVPSMLWALLPSGEPTHSSRRLTEYLGAPMDDFLNFEWKKVIHPEDLEETMQYFLRSVHTGEPYSVFHRIRRADGEYRWHHAMAEPFRDADGKITQWYGLSIDIDARKRAEDHLRETRARLNEASKIAMVAELSASIAHELNQPLMSVLGNAQAAKRWLAAVPPNLEEAAISIERIIRDARTADQTMKNIRTLFKRGTFVRRTARVADVITATVRLVQEDRNKRGVPIECFFEENLPEVFVDPIQIQEVFINLISNAIEAMEISPREPSLSIRAGILDPRQVMIQVIDNGPGIVDPERIFDAFATTKETGMGIGLAVSRSIVEAHEGQLRAENNLEFGAALTLILPVANAGAA
jgi:PAS domain S-box-containing protein